MKQRRQQAILELVRRESLPTQRAILDRLRDRGFDVTQPTVSRDLEDLGLARVRGTNGELRYAPPEQAGRPRRMAQLKRLLEEFALGMEPSGNLVLIRTPPGAANAVAEVLDEVAFEDIAGTVAGDDTILLVAREGVRGRTLVRRLERLVESRP
ncbi:MAG: arginine repressor [Actinomycetota bacterium]